MKHLSKRSFVIALSVSLMTVGVFAACKKKQEAKVEPVRSTSRVTLEGSIVENLPKDAHGFAYVNLEHDAYAKFLESPWGQKGNDWMNIPKADERLKEVQDLVKEFGVDFTEPKSLSTVFAEAALFLAPTEGSAPIAFIFRAPSESRLSELRTTLKMQLEKKGKKLKDLEIAERQGFVITVDTQSQNPAAGPQSLDIYFLTRQDIGVFAPSQALAEKALAGDKGLPDVVKTDLYKKASLGLGNDSATYMFGYLDLAGLIASNKTDIEKMSKHKEALDAVGGITSLAWSGGMDATPFQELRISLSETGNKTVSALKPSSGEVLAKFVPPSPMLVLSLDASIFAPILDAVQKNAGAQISFQDQIPWLKDLKKIGLSLSVSQPGILPIPNLSLSLQVKDPAPVEEFLKGALSQLVAASGMVPDPSWKANEKQGATVQRMAGPMGTSLNLTSKENVVLLSSNSQELATILNGSNKPSTILQSTLSKERYFTLNVDFEQTATFMQNMSGVLAMYAPQDDNANEFLSEEAIEMVRKMGVLATTLEHHDEMLSLSWRYHQNNK